MQIQVLRTRKVAYDVIMPKDCGRLLSRSRTHRDSANCADIWTVQDGRVDRPAVGDDVRAGGYLPSAFNFTQSLQRGFPPVPPTRLCAGISLPGPQRELS
jgi:hypothetical protein